MKSFVILDLDNCISDDHWRIPEIDWTQQDPELRYQKYHHLSPFDRPGNADLWVGRDKASCVVFTARPESLRVATTHWLRKFDIPVHTMLMRGYGDHRPSAVLKLAMLAAFMEQHDVRLYEFEAAYDDRPDVVAMYKKAGITAHVRAIHQVCAMTPPRKELA